MGGQDLAKHPIGYKNQMYWLLVLGLRVLGRSEKNMFWISGPYGPEFFFFLKKNNKNKKRKRAPAHKKKAMTYVVQITN